MKTLVEFIKESYQIDEKLSFGEKFDKWINNTIFKCSFREQHETARFIQKQIDELSDGKIGVSVMKAKEIESKIDNCINAYDEVQRTYNDDATVKRCFKERILWNDIHMKDDLPFICLYNKEGDKNKFFVWIESPWYFTSKDKRGNRKLMGAPIFDKSDKDDKDSYTWFFYNVAFPQILDPEGWKEKQKKEKAEIKRNAKARIEEIQKELEELKKQMED